MKNNRRQFLKNTSLATLAFGVAPSVLAKNKSSASTYNLQEDCDVLTEDLYGEGPFYTENAPIFSDGVIAAPGEPGTRLIVTGQVRSLDCSEVIPETILDLWQTNAASQYDNEGFNLRGKVLSNSQGFYRFETILPGKYLNGNRLRPRHIHVKVTTPGNEPFTTQLYFEGDTSIPDDPAASRDFGQFDATNRIIPLTDNDGTLEGTWDIVIDGGGVLGTEDLHLSKGIIYNVSPNPFEEELQIYYGVFKPSNIKIEIYNMDGKLAANVEEKDLKPEKYYAVWKPQKALPSGIYFCILKVNGLQVHYKKILKK